MRKIFLLLPILSVSACGPLVSASAPGLAEVDVLSLMGTEKTVVDHLVSLSSGKDCSAVRREKGQYYCKEDEPRIEQNIYCYNTLGSVTCYTKPDPYGAGQRKVGENNSSRLVRPSPVNR